MFQAVISGTRPSATECNEFVRTSYCWRDVARRTEVVYQSVSTGLKLILVRKVGQSVSIGLKPTLVRKVGYQSVPTGLNPTHVRKVGLTICFYWYKSYSC